MLRKALTASLTALMLSGWAGAADFDFDQGKLDAEQFLTRTGGPDIDA
jgi:hypothetical protein